MLKVRLQDMNSGKEMDMDMLAAYPDWMVWFAAGLAGAFALTALAGILDALFELDAI
jgi:hypothetical protein